MAMENSDLDFAGEAPPSPLRRYYRDHEQYILGALMVVAFFVIWEGLARGWWADLFSPLYGGAARWRLKPIFISSPTRILTMAWRLFAEGDIWSDLGTSAVEYFTGFFLAIFVGVPLGLVAGWYRRLDYAVTPILTAFNATPQVAFIPLLVLWFDTGMPTRVLIVFLLAVLPVAMSAMAGVKTIDARLLNVGRSFGSGQLHVFRSIVLPSCVPFILAGLRLAVGRAMIGIVVGELYGAASGIGFMINEAGSHFETDRVFVGLVIITIFGLSLTGLIRRIERRVEIWRPRRGNTQSA